MRYIKTKYYNKKEDTLKYIMLFMFLGSFLGAIFFCFTSNDIIEKLDVFIDGFIVQLNENTKLSIINLIEIFLKDTKYFIFIWFLAFIYLGEIFIYLIIFCKGFFIGFTGAIFFNNYNFKMIGSMFNGYILENIINIILIFYMSYKAITYCKNRGKKIQLSIKNYIKPLIICITINTILFMIFYYIK